MRNKFWGGFTLIELLIAMSLVGMIVIAVVALQVSAHKFLTSADWESRVQNEASPILERIVKDISRATGDVNNPAVDKFNNGQEVFRVRRPDATPSDLTDNSVYDYNYDAVNHQIIFWSGVCDAPPCPYDQGPSNYNWGTNGTVIAKNISNCEFRFDITGTPPSVVFTAVSITITARRDAANGSTVIPNPTVVLETSVAVR